MDRYTDEFNFRLNIGNVRHDNMERMDNLVDGAFDKRLTFTGLIGVTGIEQDREIDFDALDEITDKVLAYRPRPPQPKCKRQPRERRPAHHPYHLNRWTHWIRSRT